MAKKRSTKRALLTSVVSLLLCFVMLLGTTYAWFTDVVTSGSNIIAAGNLDIELYHADRGTNGVNERVDKNTKLFDDVDSDLWEPGAMAWERFTIKNEGSLALQYTFALNATKATVVDGVSFASMLRVALVDENFEYKRENVEALPASAWSDLDALDPVISSNAFKAGDTHTFGIVIWWKPSENDNLFNMNNGKTDTVSVEVGVVLHATQVGFESDSFDSDYDADAQWPVLAPGETFTATTNVTSDTNGNVANTVTIGDTAGDIFASVPAGVQMVDGATSLTLTVEALAESESNVTATNRSEVLRSVDVHIDGVAKGNTVPMAITLNGVLPSGLNRNNVKLYHVEDGVTVEMTLVDNPANHNEFSYDPATGNVVMTIASFSEIVVYGDTAAAWDGTVATEFAVGTGTEADPYIIASGDQLAYFRNQVDAGNTFEGKFVKLTANINLNGINFDPIGFGYDYDGFMADGKTFNGTFDGNGKTIFGLYQNGWDLDPNPGVYDTYTYSMAGGGLFASVVDATIKNLTVSGADIVFECVDMGVVCGYAQGNCTFDNIAIVNCTIQNYNRYTGGVVGECSPRYDANGTPLYSNHLFNNIRVDSTTVVSSLWGSFDTSLGGILGGKWDKYGDTTKVTMTNCDVACKIDAFNDVTSAYQWYAYRRAGMLIGNTEQSADHKALANFLTCENVHVYYGEWNNYHYCEFTNQSGKNSKGEDVAWQNNYPWVRVESGLSCGAYSNPRYGHPIVNSIAIADSIHGHQTGDECMISLPFRQLYGGGQGVYGATEHTGVSEGAYTVTYISYAKTVKVEFVADNTKVHTLWDVKEHTVGTSHPLYWENGHGDSFDVGDKYKDGHTNIIPAGNTTNYIFYPRWPNELTIRFHDAEGNMLYHEHFKEGSAHQLNMTEVNAAINALQTKLDATKRVIIVSWNTDVSKINFSDANADITVHAKYELSTSSITLVPVYDNNEVLTHYKVVDAAETIENVVISIPPYVGTVPVASLAAGAFAGFDNLHAVVIPHRITHIGTGALAENWKNGTFGTDKGETITIYYEGTYEEWQKIKLDNGWYYGISKDTRVFFMGDDKKVDFNQGYLQFVVDKSTWLGAVKEGHFDYVSVVPESFISEYNKNCDCNVDGCAGEPRPDATYWQFDTTPTND